MDGCEPPESFLPGYLVPARPEPRVPLPPDRVLERDARIRAAQGVSRRRARAARIDASAARRMDGARRHLHGAERSRSRRADMVAPHVTAYERTRRETLTACATSLEP